MGVLTRLKIVLGADTSEAMAALAKSNRALDSVESSANRAQDAMGSIKAPDLGKAPKGEEHVDRFGAQMAAALQVGLAPLQRIEGTIAGQFNRVGGTITTLARRIDAAMKFPAIDAFLTKIRDAAPAGFFKMAAAGVQSFMRIRNTISSFGDVAGKSLDRLNAATFANPIAGAKKFAGTMNTQVTRSVQGSTMSVVAFGRQLMVALGVFGLAFKAVEFFKKGISGAMALNETLSKTKEVFGEASGAVVAQADQMAKAFGLNKGAMLDGAASIGLIAKAAGQTESESAALSNKMVKLAADAESLQNIPLAQTLEKIRSGLVGQSEPLLALGVLMNEGAVKAEALRLGLSKGKKELDDRAKVAARASIIERGLATASGDLARTQDSAANQFRKAGGGLDNFATQMGTLLLPAVTAGATAFNELLSSIVELAEGGKAKIEGFANGVKDAFDTTGVVLRNSGDFWQIAQLSAQESVGNILAWIDTIPGNLKIVGEYLANNWTKLIRDALSYVGSLIQDLGQNLMNLGRAVVAFFKDPTQGFKFEWTPMLKGFEATADKFPELLKPKLVSMQEEMGEVFNKIDKAEKQRSATLAKIAPKSDQVKPLDATKKAEEVKFAGANVAGSKEAYSAIVQAQFGRGGDGTKDIARNTQRANGHLADISRKLDRRLAPSLAMPDGPDDFTL